MSSLFVSEEADHASPSQNQRDDHMFKPARAPRPAVDATCPYALANRQHFEDEKITRHDVTVLYTGARHQTPGLDDKSYCATVKRNGEDAPFRIVFLGKRAEDFERGQLVAQMEAERLVHGGTCDWDAIEAISSPISVEGFWRPRRWKDRLGKWVTSWEFVAAQWHYTLKGASEVITEGSAV